MKKTTQMELVEARLGGEVEALLRERLDRGDSLAQVAADWKVTRACLSVWARRFGLRSRRVWSQDAASLETAGR